ncbi:PREDICTED: uncharacterized protein LOC108770724 [Trachymyrmex cornetzi]|uniref:uncharacterized protein LOC108769367 n=1 Tax=Trachymyrmex cornetzi TaxID=471704 RepID=UPI00084F8466|nr:PREDICTED: uncharacterized protein LOC108769367 [Trachymyrmex cornetzi]XP_018377929.1 PREDICTED: uncharacterized protein LOC108770724 [Trachymyrmex cornetzi]
MEKRELPLESMVICYADDTLILTTGEDWEEAYDRGRPAHTNLRVAGTTVHVGINMKYLGLVLDSKWNFEAHFSSLSPRLEKAAFNLSRLLPNLGGPDNRARRLYAQVVASMALYGAPVWAYEIHRNRKCLQTIRQTQRRMAGRLIRAYRTTSWIANSVLAGMPPLELEARRQEEAYARITDIRRNTPNNIPVPKATIEGIREATKRNLVKKWKTWLKDQISEEDVIIGAIQDQLEGWLEAKVGLSFRATQVLTGHGCFGQYLCRIGRELTPECWSCGAEVDSARHTLRYCPAWTIERNALQGRSRTKSRLEVDRCGFEKGRREEGLLEILRGGYVQEGGN